MKTKLLFVAAICSATTLMAQKTTENVSLGANYTKSNYYNLEDGTKNQVDNSNWDLAFSTNEINPFSPSSTIRMNGVNGLELYSYSNNVSDWDNIDTVGFI